MPLHVPFRRTVREKVIESGDAKVPPFHSDTGWVEVSLELTSDSSTLETPSSDRMLLLKDSNRKKQNVNDWYEMDD